MGKGKGKPFPVTGSAAVNGGNSVKSFKKDWIVTLESFQIDPIEYNPKPAVCSPTFLTQLDQITLAWNVVVEQTNTVACITLGHKTEGIQNFGVEYALFLINETGSTIQRLTTNLLRALASTHPNCEKRNHKSFHAAISQLGPFIINDNKREKSCIKIRISLNIDQTRFTPELILKRLMDDELTAKGGQTDGRTGVIGEALWHQVLTDERKLCDVKIDCADGSLRAHSVVLADCSKDFRQILNKKGYNKRGWKLDWTNIGKEPVKSVLRYVYTRRGLDARVLEANPLEVVEATRLIGSPKELLLPIELCLIKLMDERNLGALYVAAKKQQMHVLENAVMTRLDNDINRLSRMLTSPELNEYYGFAVPLPVTATPSVVHSQPAGEPVDQGENPWTNVEAN